MSMTSLATAAGTLQLFAEPSRVRLCALLEKQELTVAELVAITEMGQSSVSTHLGKLREAGIVRDRRAGPSTFYAMNDGGMPSEARDVWRLVSGALDDGVLTADGERCGRVVAARARANGWPDALAGEMERHYSPGRTWEATARGFLGLVRLGDVLDAGSGDGTIAQLLLPRAKSVTCLDKSARMLDAARARLARSKSVRFVLGDVQDLPFQRPSFDHVLLFNVLTKAEQPARAIAEAARVLRKGGDLSVVTLARHAHRDVATAYHDVHDGFSGPELVKMAMKAGFRDVVCEVACREKRVPHFEVVTLFGRRASSTPTLPTTVGRRARSTQVGRRTTP
jgi:ArsR family transcriptional regulator